MITGCFGTETTFKAAVTSNTITVRSNGELQVEIDINHANAVPFVVTPDLVKIYSFSPRKLVCTKSNNTIHIEDTTFAFSLHIDLTVANNRLVRPPASGCQIS